MIMTILRFIAIGILIFGISLMVIPVVGIIFALLMELFK